MSLGLVATFSEPYYTGTSAVTQEVPNPYAVALGGRPFVLDTTADWFRQSIPLLRGQADNSVRPGESSLNPDDLWRRVIETWHHGAGQSFADREESNPARFRSSKGVDPWEQWELSLLPDTDLKLSSGNVTAITIVGTTEVWVQDGNTLKYTLNIDTDTPTWTSATGTPAAATGSLTSDGRFVYSAWGASGIYRNQETTTASTSYATGTVTVVGHAKGRLMAAGGASIYNVTAAGALPAPLFTHPNANFVWEGFGGGQTHIYAIGHIGDKTSIYRIAIKADATGLDAPIIAGELPDGEVGRAIYGYLGFILIGTDKGVRFALADAAGNLEIGSLIETNLEGVTCFEGQDRFVWFAWSDYDAVSTGLGRLDLSVFTKPNTPAFASDLMVTGSGTVAGIVTANDIRVFVVEGLGVYAEHHDGNRVAFGTIDSGHIGFNLADPKVAMFLDVRHEPLAGTVEPFLSVDAGSFTSLGSNAAVSSTGKTFPCGERRGERFEIRHKLTRSAAATTGPTLGRTTLLGYPAPDRRGKWRLPILIADVVSPDDSDIARNANADRQFIIDLHAGGAPTTLQVGDETFAVVVSDYDWRPTNAHARTGVMHTEVKHLTSP